MNKGKLGCLKIQVRLLASDLNINSRPLWEWHTLLFLKLPN